MQTIVCLKLWNMTKSAGQFACVVPLSPSRDLRPCDYGVSKTTATRCCTVGIPRIIEHKLAPLVVIYRSTITDCYILDFASHRNFKRMTASQSSITALDSSQWIRPTLYRSCHQVIILQWIVTTHVYTNASHEGKTVASIMCLSPAVRLQV